MSWWNCSMNMELNLMKDICYDSIQPLRGCKKMIAFTFSPIYRGAIHIQSFQDY